MQGRKKSRWVVRREGRLGYLGASFQLSALSVVHDTFCHVLRRSGRMKLAKICGLFVVIRQGRVFIVKSLSEAIDILKGAFYA